MILKRLLYVLVLPLLLLAGSAIAQDRVVTGRVTDTTGTAVANASVVVKGGKTGTQTAADGAFSLRVPNNATSLTISYVGFAAQDVAIGSGNLSVRLSPTGSALNEVVVIGYGTQRRRDVTGSVATVTSKDFVKGPITSPEQLIAGKVAGVQITPNSGQPGSGSRIRIRGGTSLNASNAPLIVIDGVPVDNGGISGASSPLSMINPNDIESMTILKDASAAAIYGNRAANGVILITTKKGVAGRLIVSFSTLNSISKNTDQVDVLNADEFRALVNARGTASDKALLGTASTNWQDQIYRAAFSTDNNISVTGGIARLPYRFNLGYLNQDGILKRSNMQRSSVGLNLSPKFLANHLSVDVNTKYSFQKNFFANTGAIGAAVFFDPTKPVLSGKNVYGGYYEWVNNNTLNGLAPKNPVGLLEQREDKSDVNRFLGNVQLDYKMHFLPELRANVNIGLDQSSGKGTIFVPATAASDTVRGGVNNQYDQEKTNKLFESYLAYAKDILSLRSRFDLVAGYSYQDWLTTSNAYPDRRANGTIFTPAGQDFETQNTLVSFYGRLNYTFNNRYSATFTMRRDGSSRFSENNRWGNFPSAAIAWNLKEASFFKNNSFLTALKLRLGWGIIGQQEGIGNYGYQPNYFYGDSAARYQFGNTYNVVARPSAYDENLKWEETESRNVGIDISFANNRINFIADYYNKDTRDLLAVVPAPAGTNFSNQLLTNVGSIKNQGLEFTLNVTPVKREGFTLDLGYNVTYLLQNDITKLQLVKDPSYLGADVGSIGINGTIQKHTVGYRPNTFFLYKQVYDPKDGKPIEGLYEDKNRDGKIDELDKYWVKNPEPRAYMGFSANASSGKLSAGFSMRGSYGNYVYNNLEAGAGIFQNVSTGQNYLNNAHREILESRFAARNFWSDYYLENASFLRMDNAFVNYNVGKVWNDRANLRLSLNVQNVFVITKYSGLDPEVGGGIDGSVYPRPRMYALGVNLDF
jgi:TonB-linked SusC/RagA family outer membrane protein